jgi:hypothetical protein
MNNFDKLVEKLLKESDSYGFDHDQIGAPEDVILGALKAIRKTIKKNQIADKNAYTQLIKFVRKATASDKITDINHYDEETSPFYEAILQHVTNNHQLAWKIFQDVTNAFMKGEKDRIPEDTEEDDDKFYGADW